MANVLHGVHQTSESRRKSQRTKRKDWAKILQGRDKSGQPGVHVETRVQTIGERAVKLGVGGENVGAPGAALGLMALKTILNFLGWNVSGLRPLSLIRTYSDNISYGVGVIAVASASRKRPDLGFTIVDGIDELEDNLVGAVVVTTGIELGEESVTLGAEVVEDGWQTGSGGIGGGGVGGVGGCVGGVGGFIGGIGSVGGGIRDDIRDLVGGGGGGGGIGPLGDDTGEGNSAGSEDSEDGRETHGEYA